MTKQQQLNKMGLCAGCSAKCCRDVSLDNLTLRQAQNFKKQGVKVSHHLVFGWMAHLNATGCPEIGKYGQCKVHNTQLQPQTCKNLAAGSEYCLRIRQR